MANETLNDTICAVSTPPGAGGIAVVRLSGPRALKVFSRIWKGRNPEGMTSHTAHLGMLVDSEGMEFDEAVATLFRGPHSFTGEDTVEISVHGSRWIQRHTLEELISAGARLAFPGEFSQRAFASGRLDLAQAEAVADMIAANSKAAARVALRQMRGGVSRKLDGLRAQLLKLASLLELELDFSEEDVEFASRETLIGVCREILDEIKTLLKSFRAGSAIKDGIPVAIIGATNAGKSSLLNALIGDERAIVSDIHGTTRDTVEDTIEIGDYLFRFIDTAGFRNTDDAVERLGIERSRRAAASARIILDVIDGTDPSETFIGPTDEDVRIIRLINKCDALDAPYPLAQADEKESPDTLYISAKTGLGIDVLQRRLEEIASQGAETDDSVLITNARHAEALALAARSAEVLLEGLHTTLPADLLAQDLRQTLHQLSAISGEITTPEILNNIFANFCIGK